MGNVSSLEIMTSMYWLKREFYYGPRNPDKTFYLIKQPVKENGITALVSNLNMNPYLTVFNFRTSAQS